MPTRRRLSALPVAYVVASVAAALAVVGSLSVVFIERTTTPVQEQMRVVAQPMATSESRPRPSRPPTMATPTSSKDPSVGPTISPTGSPSDAPRPIGFDEVDRATAAFLTRDARWHVPSVLDVDQTSRIGLVIGSAPGLTTKINELLPSTAPVGAGPVQIGPKIRVTLRADPHDATIIPSESVDASTGSDVQIVWTWFVRPSQPTSALLLTAHLALPLDNGHVIVNELPLVLRVRRTVTFTAQQIFSNWATWSAIGAAIIGLGGWLWRRRQKNAVPMETTS